MFAQITLSGSAYERGRHYGTRAAPLIRRTIATYAMLFAYRNGINWQTAQEQAQPYLALLAVQTPDILEEMRGIADGAACRLAEIAAINARTELLAGHSTRTRHAEAEKADRRNRTLGVPDPGECTMLAAVPPATTRGNTLLAQTWDWITTQRDACVLLRIEEPGRPPVLTLTEAGMVAKIGLNGAGVGVCLNILQSTRDGREPALPIHVLLRLLLRAQSVQEGLAVLQRTPVAASSCISLADATGEAICAEVTPGGMGLLQPHEGVLVHTNHCLSEQARASECALEPASSTLPRYKRATTLIHQQRGEITCASLQDILSDRQGAPLCICRTPDRELPLPEQSETVAAVVLDLQQRIMHLAPGQPSAVDFVPLALT